jgi:hypothetical protein
MMVIRAQAAADLRCGSAQWRGRAVLVQREATSERLAMKRERDNREGERVTPPTAWPAMARWRRSIGDDARERGERCRVCTGAERARQELDHGFYRVRATPRD